MVYRTQSIQITFSDRKVISFACCNPFQITRGLINGTVSDDIV